MEGLINNIGILGCGSFGTALANLYAEQGFEVSLWGRDSKVVDDINLNSKNNKYLPGTSLNKISATTDVSKVLNDNNTTIFAIPTQFIRSFLIKNCHFILKKHILINVAKGIENGSLSTPFGIFKDVLGQGIVSSYLTISGPSFAKELIQKMPTGATLAGENELLVQQMQTILSAPYFRLYTSNDVLGAELGGALKNVMALAVGISDGLGFGQNTRAGLLTRCLFEMTELAKKMGANPKSFMGLSGVGDLMLTCFGDLSRNRTVGLKLGQGQDLKSILNELGYVAEGVATTLSVHELQKIYNVDMPNASMVYQIIQGLVSPKKAVENLLSRELKREVT